MSLNAFSVIASGSQPLPIVYSLIFPFILAGGISLGIIWLRRRKRILLHGLTTTGLISTIEPTIVRINRQVQHRIFLIRADNGLTVSARVHRPAAIDFFRDQMNNQRPVAILYDPEHPDRILLPDVWNH